MGLATCNSGIARGGSTIFVLGGKGSSCHDLGTSQTYDEENDKWTFPDAKLPLPHSGLTTGLVSHARGSKKEVKDNWIDSLM